MDKVQKHDSFNTNTPSSESYRNYWFVMISTYFEHSMYATHGPRDPNLKLQHDHGRGFLRYRKSIWHHMASRLTILHFSSSLIELINLFLFHRKFRVMVEGGLSTPRNIQAGVLQGFVLSPTLYSIYINNTTQTQPSPYCRWYVLIFHWSRRRLCS